MTEKKYKILLAEKLLGTTKLEFGNPPMGVVFGQINFAEKILGTTLLNSIALTT